MTDTKLICRITQAHNELTKIQNILKKTSTGVSERRIFVKTFVFSVCDYAIHIQPMTRRVLHKARELEHRAVYFILDYTLTKKQHNIGRLLSAITPILGRRRCMMANALYNYYRRSIDEERGGKRTRTEISWKIMKETPAAKRLLRENNITLDPDAWLSRMKTHVHETIKKEGSDRYKRVIPSKGSKLPPVLQRTLLPCLEK